MSKKRSSKKFVSSDQLGRHLEWKSEAKRVLRLLFKVTGANDIKKNRSSHPQWKAFRKVNHDPITLTKIYREYKDYPDFKHFDTAMRELFNQEREYCGSLKKKVPGKAADRLQDATRLFNAYNSVISPIYDELCKQKSTPLPKAKKKRSEGSVPPPSSSAWIWGDPTPASVSVSPKLRAKSPLLKAQLLKAKSFAPKTKRKSPKLKSQSPKFKAKSPKSKVLSPKFKARSMSPSLSAKKKRFKEPVGGRHSAEKRKGKEVLADLRKPPKKSPQLLEMATHIRRRRASSIGLSNEKLAAESGSDDDNADWSFAKKKKKNVTPTTARFIEMDSEKSTATKSKTKRESLGSLFVSPPSVSLRFKRSPAQIGAMSYYGTSPRRSSGRKRKSLDFDSAVEPRRKRHSVGSYQNIAERYLFSVSFWRKDMVGETQCHKVVFSESMNDAVTDVENEEPRKIRLISVARRLSIS